MTGSEQRRDGSPALPAQPISLTVAIACYNHGRFLPEAIASVLAQTREPDAVLLVDDGSRDATAAIGALFPTVRYYYQDNAGLAAARNTALRLADTSHILFLDADDLLLPDTVARALAHLATDDAPALLYAGYRDVDVIGSPLRDHPPIEPENPYLALLRTNFIAMHGTVVYDVAALRSLGGFDTALPNSEDWDVYLRLARDHPVGCYGGIAAAYRRHDDGMSSDHARMIAVGAGVLHRQQALADTVEERTAAAAGLAFLRRLYGRRLASQLWRTLALAARQLGAGLRNDPRFALRLLMVPFRRRR